MADNVVSMANFQPFNPSGVLTKENLLLCATNKAIRDYVSPVTGLTGQPTSADYRDPNAAAKLTADILCEVDTQYKINNAMISSRGGVKWQIPTTLAPHIIADLLVRTNDFCMMMPFDGRKGAKLLMRVRTGSDIGIWCEVDPDNPAPELMEMIANLKPSVVMKEIVEIVRRMTCDIRLRRYDPQEDFDSMLVHCNNGIFNLRDRSFVAYDDPRFDDTYGNCVSTWKLAVDYNPNASQMPVISTPNGDWTWDQQLLDVFDVPGVDATVRDACISACWHLTHFLVRGISGGMGVWLTNASAGSTGRNGKSVLLGMLRGLVGARNTLSLSIEGYSKRFALARLPYVCAIMSDETASDVTAIEDCADYKSLITGEPVEIEAKGKPSFSYGGFHGCQVQAMNGVSKLAGTGSSLWRRILIIRFERCFETMGRDNPLIKSDYIKRPDVLQAILYRALHMDPVDRYPDDVVNTLNRANKGDIRSQSSKVWAAMSDFEPLLKEWAQRGKLYSPQKPFRIPIRMLYDAYRDKTNGWSVKNGYSMPLSYNSFQNDLASWLGEHASEWKYHSKETTTSIYSWIADTKYGVSPLFDEYPATEWATDGTYAGAINERGRMKLDRLPTNARGVIEYIGD